MMNACHHERKPKMQCGGRRKRSESPPETKPSAGKAVRGSDIKLDRTYSALEAKSNILSPPPTPQISDGRPSVNQIWGLDGQQQGAPRGAHWKSNQRITEIKTSAFEATNPETSKSQDVPNLAASETWEVKKYCLDTFIKPGQASFTDSPGTILYENDSPPSSVNSDIESNYHYLYELGGWEGDAGQDDPDTPRDSKTGERPGEPAPRVEDTNKEPKKRSHETAFSDSVDGNGGRAPAPGSGRGASGDEGSSEAPFACPFYKLDIQKHHRCLRYHLRRIKDVKQHIARQHRAPELYCARCYTVFADEARRDRHVRRADCAVRDAAPPAFGDGVSPEQRRKLSSAQYAARGRSAADQWFYVWDVLFPGRPRPGSVYVGNYVEEVAQLLRANWRSRGAEIISRVSPAAAGPQSTGGGGGGGGVLCAEGLERVMDLLLSDLVEASSPHADVGTPIMYTASTDSAVSPTDSLPGLVSEQCFGNDGPLGIENCFNGWFPDFEYGDPNLVGTQFWESRAGLQQAEDLPFEISDPGLLLSQVISPVELDSAYSGSSWK